MFAVPKMCNDVSLPFQKSFRFDDGQIIFDSNELIPEDEIKPIINIEIWSLALILSLKDFNFLLLNSNLTQEGSFTSET